MTDENIEQVEQWFEELYDWDKLRDAFEKKENKLAEAEQVCAVLFLYNKLKPEHKSEKFFFHGEHDKLYIGSSFDIFEDFTKEDVEEALMYGISISDIDDGFEIYASM